MDGISLPARPRLPVVRLGQVCSFWKECMNAYEAYMSVTSSKHSPCYVVPADDKEHARLIIADISVETLRDMDLQYPQLDAEPKRELTKARELLTASSKSREKLRVEAKRKQ